MLIRFLVAFVGIINGMAQMSLIYHLKLMSHGLGINIFFVITSFIALIAVILIEPERKEEEDEELVTTSTDS